jgi:drug/metabolite transporter (DMT)-like permease
MTDQVPSPTLGEPTISEASLERGLLTALLAYGAFAWGDACVKTLGGKLSVFEIGFFSTFFAGIFLLFSRPRGERWRHFLKMKRPWLVQARALSGIGAGVLGVYAFTTIPFAEAYALIFLSPLLVTLLSTIILKESVAAWRWAAVLAGFAGVFLVVRPGFRELSLGHLAAVGIALAIAASVLLLRAISGQERRTTVLGVMVCYGLVFNGIAALATGADLPAPSQLALLVLSGAFAAGGQILLLLATKQAPASRIAPMHYSQIAWATALGALAFGEYPDSLALVGLAVLSGTGLLLFIGESGRLGLYRWRSFFRNRL